MLRENDRVRFVDEKMDKQFGVLIIFNIKVQRTSRTMYKHNALDRGSATIVAYLGQAQPST